jgi:ankyrin repeat protein
MTQNLIFTARWRDLLSRRWVKYAMLTALAVGMALFARYWQVMSLRNRLSNPLVIAAKAGDYPKVEALLKQGADPNSRLLLYGSLKERIDDWLDSFGRPPDGWLTDPTTALVAAASNGHTSVVRLLLEYGADVHLRSTISGGESPDPTLHTALELAKYKHYTEIEHLLEQAGATQ